MRHHLRRLSGLTAAALAALALTAPALADNTTSDFASSPDFQGCLGGLRSAIARGDLAGARLPDGTVIPDGFFGGFNPGDHLGTRGEAEFLTSHGVTDLAAFCSQFN
jgi:hypothetical protein